MRTQLDRVFESSSTLITITPCDPLQGEERMAWRGRLIRRKLRYGYVTGFTPTINLRTIANVAWAFGLAPERGVQGEPYLGFQVLVVVIYHAGRALTSYRPAS